MYASLCSFLRITLNPSEGLNPRNVTLLTLTATIPPRNLVLQHNLGHIDLTTAET